MALQGRSAPRWREEATEERRERGPRGWREAWSPAREPRAGRERAWSPQERRASSWASFEGEGAGRTRWASSEASGRWSPGERASVERERTPRASAERPWSRERSWGSPERASRASWDCLEATGRAREAADLWSPRRPLSRTPSPPKAAPPRMRRQEWEAQQVKRPRWEPQDQSRKKPAGWNNPELEAPLEEPQKGTKRIPNQRWGGHKETWSSLAAEEPRKKRRRAGRGHLKRGWSGPRGRGRGRGWSGPGRAFAAEARDPGGPTWQPHESFHEQARGRYNEEDSDAEAPDKLGEWSPESEAGDAESVGKEGGRVSGRKGEPQADAPAPAAPAVPTVVTSSAPPSGKRSTARAKWMPCKEVANFWMNQCQVIIGKKTRGYLRTTCPRPWLPDHSTQTPSLNKRVVLQLKRPHLKRLSYACHKWQVLQNELLDMAAPAMTVYEMAEEALAKGEAVEPLELREWARHLLRYIGSLSQRLLLYRRGEVLAGINPQLRNMAQRMNDRTVNGRLFTDDNMRLLEEVLNKFPYLTQASEWTRPGEALDGLRREPADRAQPDSTRHRFISEDFPDARPSSSSFA